MCACEANWENKYPLDMNLDEALEEFQFKKNGKYSSIDLNTVRSICSELLLSEFELKIRKDIRNKDGEPYVQYFRDTADKVHFHSEMIVARSEFTGCLQDRKSKYKAYPYMVELSHWKSTETKVNRPICPRCFIEFPLSGECGLCGLDLDSFEDE